MLIAACAFLACGRGGDPWREFPMSTPPDRQCRKGTEGGYDVYVWNCHDGARVVIYKYFTYLGSREPVREEVPCGGRAPIEERLKLPDECKLPPEGFRWP